MEGQERWALRRGDRAVLETLLPSQADPTLSLGIVEIGFENFLVEFAALGAPNLRRAFRLALFAASWISPLLIRRAPPLQRLGPTDREQALAAMELSSLTPMRQLTRVLKTVVALHYGAHPEVRRAIGYHQ
jgi:hypothetical protein